MIEHAFIDNYGDVYNFLSREDKVKEMGYADATAIAEYYGLSKNGNYGSKATIADTIRTAYDGGTSEALTPIMTTPTTSVDRMVSYYKSNATFPTYYQEHDTEIKASSNPLQTFCQIFYDEAVAEGVDPGVVFAQAMKETGFLRFGGDVKIEQYNFCGLGATGGGAAGQAFGSVRLGVSAQVQHLKAYASQEDLKNAVVDPRFQYVTRGCATFVEYLGIQENPWGKGWATASNYGYSIVNDYMYKFCTVKKTSSTANSFLNVAYSTHVQSYGWQADKFNGMTSGTTGLGKRLEAIKIKVGGEYDLGVTYQTHVQTLGWGNWVDDGALSGTTGQAKRLEAIRIKLTGNDADKFDVYYRVHSQTYGWLDWACNGEASGTSGLAKRLEAIEIVLVEKGETAPGETRYPYVDAAIAKQIEKEKEEERKRQEEAEKEANDKATSENLRKVLSEAVLVPTITRDTAIDTKVQEVLAQVVKPEMDNYDKLLACYKWIIDNSFYKYDGFTGSWNNTNVSYSNNRDRQVVSFAKTIICGVNGQRYGTCINYGSAMVVFARALGFEAYRVGGETLRADNSYGEHYWCVIKINGIWYNFDPQNADNNWTDPLRYFGKTNSEWLGIGYKFTHGSEKAEDYIKGGTYK